MIFLTPHRYLTPKWQAKIIPEASQFHFHLGPTVSSLIELKNALTVITDTTLTHHVNSSKHDIADWVEFAILDTDLAKSLRSQTHRWGLIVSLERHMMRTLNLPNYIASRWLSSASSPLMFVSGESASSLDELNQVLQQTSDETVDYHLERVPNDISQWVLLNIGDYQLSELLEEASNRSQMQRFVADHIAMLKDASQ